MTKTENKFHTCKTDVAFKYVMLDEEVKEVLKTILEFILNKKINKIKILKTELIEESVHTKGKRVDAYIETDKDKINIEVNSNYKDYLHIRNMAYMCNFYERNYLSGEKYKDDESFIQINLTYGLKEENIIRKYNVMDEEGKLFVKNFTIYEINMAKIMNFWYHKDKKKIKEFKHLIMLDLNLEDLNVLSKKDKVVKKYMERLERVNQDPKFQAYMSYEEDQRKIRNTEISEARENGIMEGIEQGSNNRNIEIAKNMLSMDIKIEDISKATGLSIEEIESLK